MERHAYVYVNKVFAGVLTEYDEGYRFQYDSEYLAQYTKPVSLTLPLMEKSYDSKTLFSFFDGLIPEGWLLDIAVKNWKLSYQDRFSLLLVCCKDCIGNVTISGEKL